MTEPGLADTELRLSDQRKIRQGLPLSLARKPEFRLTFRYVTRILARVMIFVVPIFAFSLSLHQIKGGWDDGAITAAFARTFAEVGRFALTPVSAQVEGFSSVTWVFLLTVPRYFSRNPDAIVIWMKLLSAIALLLSLLVFRRIANRLLSTAEQGDMACVLVSLMVGPILETLNGMEMNLCTLLVLCLVDVLTDPKRRHRTLAVCSLTAVLVATRFESPFWITGVLLGLIFSRETRDGVQLAVSTGAAFLGLEAWRFLKFGAWMPNTVYAKMQPPYSPAPLPIPMLRNRIMTLQEILQVLGGLLVAVLLVRMIAFLTRRLPVPQSILTYRRTLSILLSCVLLAFGVLGVPYVARNLSNGVL